MVKNKMIKPMRWGFETAEPFTPKFPLPLDIQFFAIDPELYSFGLADISIFDQELTPLKFDGKDYLQADGGEINLTPSFRDINFKDSGDTVDQRRLGGWEGTVTFVVGQEDIRLMKLALSAVVEITDATTSEVVGLTDAKLGSVLQGYKVVIHPRVLPATNKDYDYTIYQMASTGGITRAYNDEQTTYSITLNMMPRVGFDATQTGNFFYTGPVDPHAAV